MTSRPPIAADLLITNGMILPLSPNSQPMERGSLAVSGGRIVAIGGRTEIESRYHAPKIIDARGGLIMPGLINGHTHLPMSFLRGYADDLPLDIWLKESIFPAEAKWVGEDFVYWGSLLSLAEMIRSGTTTLADGYFFEEVVARAVEKAGLRALLGEGILDFPSPDSPSPEEALKKTEAFIQQYRNSPLIQPFPFPHTIHTCSPPVLARCFELAKRYGVPVMIHLAETKSEVEEVKKRFGKRPVEHMEALGLLSASLIACHCVWLTEEEMDLMASRGVRVVHNPESNMKLASGVAPVPELLARGIPVGLGTDGCASNNNLDLFREMDAAAKLHKVHRLDPTVMPSPAVLEMATLGGARALGLEKEVGSLEVGKKADVIVVELNRPHLQPLYNVVSHLVYSASGADVRDVVIDGRPVMENRTLLTLDEEEILCKAKEWANKIRSS